MSMNSSSTYYSISSTLPLGIQCLIYRPSSIIFISFSITKILFFIPVCIFILYSGLQQWWRKHFTSSRATVSHSDSFTYHMATMELIGVFECIICCFAIYKQDLNMLLVGASLYFFIWYGQVFFHVLTCVERYLAVVHPVTYMDLKKERGIRMRNISIGCVWMLCTAGAVLVMKQHIFIIVHFCFNILSIIVISFSSLSVLCVLIRPGPGDQGGDRERVDHSKQRAFYTIVLTLGLLLLKFAFSVVWAVLNALGGSNCLMMTSFVWVNFTCSLVLPLLFLYRAGKVVCCKNNIHQG